MIKSDDGDLFPATVNVVSRTDDEIGDGATIFTGYWSGDAVRPEGNPVVTCPYVLVPRETLFADSCGGRENSDGRGTEEISRQRRQPNRAG